MHGPTAVAPGAEGGSIVIGNRNGAIVIPGFKKDDKNVFGGHRLLHERVVGLDCRPDGQVLVIGPSGEALMGHPGRAEWRGVSRPTMGRIVLRTWPSAGSGLQWLLCRDEVDGEYRSVVALLVDGFGEEVALSEPERLQDFCLSSDESLMCLAGAQVRVLRRSNTGWVPFAARGIPADRIRLLEATSLLAVVPHDSNWLELWRLSDGLPILTAIECSADVASIVASDDRVVLGLSSGTLMSLRVHAPQSVGDTGSSRGG